MKNERFSFIMNSMIDNFLLIKQSLARNTVLSDYARRPWLLLEYALDQFSLSPYGLILSSQEATATVFGLKTKQIIEAYDFYTPEESYSESFSYSPFLKTKNRFYDKKNNQVLSFAFKEKENLSDVTPITLSYDEYIRDFGKLLQRKYYVVNKFTSKESLLHDAFLSLKDDEYYRCQDTTKHALYGTMIYIVNEDTVKKAKIEKEGNNYRLTFDLDIRFSNDYYATRMLNTGSLYELPKFTSSKITFLLDEKLRLIESTYFDNYSAKTGFIATSIVMEARNTYLISDTNQFVYNDKTYDVKVPSLDETFIGSSILNKKN